MLVPRLDVVVSMRGACAETVTDSATPAGVICRLTLTVCPTSSSTPVRVAALKPWSSVVIRYTPIRTGIRKSPRASVTAPKLFPEASSTAVTVTPGSTAPVASVTVPLIVASCAYPATASTRIAQTKINSVISLDFIGSSSQRRAWPAATDESQRVGAGCKTQKRRGVKSERRPR